MGKFDCFNFSSEQVCLWPKLNILFEAKIDHLILDKFWTSIGLKCFGYHASWNRHYRLKLCLLLINLQLFRFLFVFSHLKKFLVYLSYFQCDWNLGYTFHEFVFNSYHVSLLRRNGAVLQVACVKVTNISINKFMLVCMMNTYETIKHWWQAHVYQKTGSISLLVWLWTMKIMQQRLSPLEDGMNWKNGGKFQGYFIKSECRI